MDEVPSATIAAVERFANLLRLLPFVILLGPGNQKLWGRPHFDVTAKEFCHDIVFRTW